MQDPYQQISPRFSYIVCTQVSLGTNTDRLGNVFLFLHSPSHTYSHNSGSNDPHWIPPQVHSHTGTLWGSGSCSGTLWHTTGAWDWTTTFVLPEQPLDQSHMRNLMVFSLCTSWGQESYMSLSTQAVYKVVIGQISSRSEVLPLLSHHSVYALVPRHLRPAGVLETLNPKLQLGWIQFFWQ